MSADAEETLVATALTRLGTLDVDGVVELVTDDLLLELPFRADGGPRRMEGERAKNFIRSLPSLFSALPMNDIVVHGKLPSGQVVAEYKSDGVTHDGRPYPNAYVGFFSFRDGRICRWREYFDPNVVAQAFPVS